MAKDRARPFSRKHRKYWIPVTGGMILIGIINVTLGYCSYSKPSEIHERIDVTPREDPARKMAREAAKRALEKRALEKRAAADAGVDASVPGQLER